MIKDHKIIYNQNGFQSIFTFNGTNYQTKLFETIADAEQAHNKMVTRLMEMTQ